MQQATDCKQAKVIDRP